MSLKHGLLGLLNYGAMTGYELSATFKSSLSFFWQAKPSQIYRELDAMEKNKWLTSERVIQTDKPNKRVYHITDAGKAEFKSWLASPDEDIAAAMRVRCAFLLRVFFAGETDDAEALSLIRAFLQSCLETVDTLRDVPSTITKNAMQMNDAGEKSKYWALTAMFGEGYYRAEIEWAQKAIAILEDKQDERAGD